MPHTGVIEPPMVRIKLLLADLTANLGTGIDLFSTGLVFLRIPATSGVMRTISILFDRSATETESWAATFCAKHTTNAVKNVAEAFILNWTFVEN